MPFHFLKREDWIGWSASLAGWTLDGLAEPLEGIDPFLHCTVDISRSRRAARRKRVGVSIGPKLHCSSCCIDNKTVERELRHPKRRRPACSSWRRSTTMEDFLPSLLPTCLPTQPSLIRRPSLASRDDRMLLDREMADLRRRKEGHGRRMLKIFHVFGGGGDISSFSSPELRRDDLEGATEKRRGK